MKRAGLNQIELATKAQIDQGHMSRVIGGTRGLSPENLARVAQVLAVSVDLLTPKEVPSRSRSAPEREVASGRSLVAFLSLYGENEKVTREERWYLEQCRAGAPWIEFDDEFWLKLLRFWRSELPRLTSNGAPTPPGSEQHAK